MSQPVTICQRVRRLIRYRYPLVVVAALNGLFLVGVPAMKPGTTTQAKAVESHSTSQASSSVIPDTAPKGTPTAEVATLERKAVHPRTRDGASGEEEAPKSPVATPLRKDRHHAERLRGVSQTVWRAGVTAAALSDWYQSVPKSDPFTETTAATVATRQQPPSADAPAADPRLAKEGTSEGYTGRRGTTEQQGGVAATTPAKPTRSQQTASPQVVLRNADADLSVAFVVDGRVFVLQPGASLQWGVTGELVVAFDRGGNFGAAREHLQPGTYVFRVDAQGWRLVPDATPSPKGNATDAEPDAQAGRSSS